ncbi:MAG: ComF family protein [Erysipelotrichaceae bacterium]|nr:ComF family protein [Erysipelotrichaceae bacterium]
MRCLYCDRNIDKQTIKSVFLKEDELCPECRRQLRVNRKILDFDGMKVETFFEYDGIFRSLLLQFKECHDEALKNVFLYDLSEYINIRYFGYKILFVPSSKAKLEQRGFNHLEEIFSEVRLKKADGLRMIEDGSQEGKNLEERRKMSTNYVYTGAPHKKILVVDDVVTTGSSLKGVYNCVKTSAGKVKVLSLAYKCFTLHY